MKKIPLTLAAASILLTAACGAEPAVPQVTDVPVEAAEINVFVESGLVNVMNEAAAKYNTKTPETTIVFDAYSPDSLISALDGAECDVLLASYAAPDSISCIDANAVSPLAEDVPVVVIPADDGTDMEFKNVYGSASLSDMGIILPPEAAEAGIIYASEAAAIKDKVEVIAAAPPETGFAKTSYWAALTVNPAADEKRIAAAKDFLEFLKSDSAAAAFTAYGFTVK